MRKLNNIAVTGGAGFIGSNFIRNVFNNNEFEGKIINIDNLTYAGNMENLKDIDNKFSGQRYFFENADICNYSNIIAILEKYDIDTVIHFAAESYVDRSIDGPKEFIQTNIVGTFNLLEVVRQLWQERDDVLFHHVSTDEVFGSLGKEGYFTETTAYDPKSPYSASKAASDHLVRAINHTYGLPVTLSNCSNNYGPYQFPEKLIPVIILNILEEKPLPVYGDGKNVRDWLFVDDHADAVWNIINNGRVGETYNIGGDKEWQNIDIVYLICEMIAEINSKEKNNYKNLITYVNDRPGHDRRYAINCSKIKKELGWKQTASFEEGLLKTIKWYMDNTDWVNNIRSGEYKN